ncbi:hypothetical protein F4V57_12395 [Acinetobacter qingfengensis]|uniref:Uncharacterized protein n=1 Tax=Acinetobacter qingfengensis TaxID=1262585 RepID=A0A1E7QXJ6_9GAMM|nr:hypothetical protein [Acinetobacter qingfengensis]KAA8731709.1 hypothetical protein F4V57_12395 [Acinetobacter qingfengensis]OEY91808.1 hypothetical protein BJI46_06645 [Acinetobacter qingfengensis]
MAMRPDVKRHSLVIIVFALAQWALVMAALHFNWWHLERNGRILAFCASVFLGAWLLMSAILYMVIKGRKPDDQNQK